MKQHKLRACLVFATPILAGLAFVVGAVKIWGVAAGRVWGLLALVLGMVVALALLAFVVVSVVKLVGRRWRK